MTDRIAPPPLDDAKDRNRIAHDHDHTLIVEAAAGTGKTTAVVSRVVELLASGKAEVPALAAITFTDKAAGELRLRIRQGLETRIAAEEGDSDLGERLTAALSQLEDASIGTIHAFAGTLLRERPVEAGVDPDFTILSGAARLQFFDRIFAKYLDEQLRSPGEGVKRLLRRNRGFRDDPLRVLRDAGLSLLDYRDWDAPWERARWNGRAEVRKLVNEGDLMSGPGDPGQRIPSLSLIADAYEKAPRQNADGRINWLVWSLGPAADLAREIAARGGVAKADPIWMEQALATLLIREYAGRNPPGMPFLHGWRDRFRKRLREFAEASNADLAALLREDLRGLVAAYEEAKRSAGVLDFDDLLIRTRDLLVQNPEVRRELRDRFRQIVVDEYQDTDPIQTEILMLLTAEDPPSDAPAGSWRTAVPLPGRLCLVGDPKQSIYRFRRADVDHYLATRDRLVAKGTVLVRLNTNFRSTPDICDFVNEVMAPVFRAGGAPHESPRNSPPERAAPAGRSAQQVPYSPIRPYRRDSYGRDSLAAIPLTSQYANGMEREEPAAVARFVKELLESDRRVLDPADPGAAPRPVEPRDICLLFRRFRSVRGLIPQPYVRELEALAVPHSLAAVQSYTGSVELSVLRTALTAVETPDDPLHVYGTLRGPLFAIPDQDLLVFRELTKERLVAAPDGGGGAVAGTFPGERTIREALGFLYRLHEQRNQRPIAETLNELLGEHRAETGFAFWRLPEQVLSNIRRLLESARAFEAAGGLSFRGFVEQLDKEAKEPDFGATHAMDEDVAGVRIMTVHSAKGLEFPVVILCDAALTRKGRAARIVRPEQRLHACDLGNGIRPRDLLREAEEEEKADVFELDRLLYVAMTRARDLLVAPVPPEGTVKNSLLNPVARGLRERFDLSGEAGDNEPVGLPSDRAPVRRLPAASRSWTVLEPGGNEEAVRAGAAAEAEFVEQRRRVLDRAAIPRRSTLTATALAEQLGEPGAAAVTGLSEAAVEAVEIHRLPTDRNRPGGAGFGVLAHHILERIPFASGEAAVRLAAEAAARELGLPPDYAAPAARAVLAALGHPLLEAARRAEAAADGTCHREAPLLHTEELVVDGARSGAVSGEDPNRSRVVVEGACDLAFRIGPDGPWTVVDFKTDSETPGSHDPEEQGAAYRRQVALYARAISRATGQPARAALLFL